MTKTNQAAEKGERFLLDNHDKYRLVVEYSDDMDNVSIQLIDKETEAGVVFDGSDVFRQIHEYFSNKPKLYKLTLDGQDFTGTAEDVARHYCKQKGIKLYILPDQLEHDALTLFALFDDRLVDIAQLETGDDSDNDIESGYKLFCTEYMLEGGNPDINSVELK